MLSDDTIIGIATATGRASVTILRISGNKALLTAQKFFCSPSNQKIKKFQSHRVYYGWIEKNSQKIDEVLLLVMKAPKSYTKEDIVEIHSHGGFAVAERLLKIFTQEGLRLAEAGEFTKRAFLNGRIDLTKVEAIQQIIDAKSLFSLELGVQQLQGKLFNKINSFREKIAWVLSLLNAQIDFIEEDVFFTNLKKARKEIQNIIAEMQFFLETAEKGIKIKEGVRVALLGYANVGKSSIMNGLMRENRSIVTPIEGTTRDTIEEAVLIQGIPFYFSDTAGIRPTDSSIEKEGINRSLLAGKKADMLLWVLDSSNLKYDIPWQKLTKNIPMLLVFNKIDLRKIIFQKLPTHLQKIPNISISALQETDIQQLEETIFAMHFNQKEDIKESVFLSNQRQKTAAQKALKALQKTLSGIEKGLGEEIICLQLEESLQELGIIVGQTTTEDLLDNIFKNFCIGK